MGRIETLHRYELPPNFWEEQRNFLSLLAHEKDFLPSLRYMFGPDNGWRNIYAQSLFSRIYPPENILAANALCQNSCPLTRSDFESNLTPLGGKMLVRVDVLPKGRICSGVYRLISPIPVIDGRLTREIEDLNRGYDVQVSAYDPEDQSRFPTALTMDQLQEVIAPVIQRLRSGDCDVSVTQADHIALLAGSLAGFHGALNGENIATCYPEVSPDGSLTMIHTLPVHLLINEAQRHDLQRRAILGNIGTVTQSHRAYGDSDGYIYPPFIHTLSETLNDILTRSARNGPPFGYTQKDIDRLSTLHNSHPDLEQYLSSLCQDVAVIVQDRNLFHPLTSENRQRLQKIVKQLEEIGTLFFQGNSGGYYGDFYKRLIEDINREIGDKNPVIANDISLTPGKPLVILGENAGGKSTLLAAIAQACIGPGQAVCSQMHLPENVQLLVAADSVELMGQQRLLSGRREHKSSFMMEIELRKALMDQVMKNDTRYLILGDEVGRRTDQLNAMALLTAELIALAQGGHYSVYASHYNHLPQVIGPLLEKLGVSLPFSSMKNYVLSGLQEGEIVKSHALFRAAPFLSAGLGRFWQEKSDLSLPTQVVFAEKYHPVDYHTLHRERLYQLGWLDKNGNLAGLAAFLLGKSYRSPHRNEFAYHKRFENAVVETLLNPRWEHAASLPVWLDILDGTDKQTLTPMMTPLRRLGKLQVDYDEYSDLKSYCTTAESLINLSRRKAELDRNLQEVKDEAATIQGSVTYFHSLLPSFPLEKIRAFIADIGQISQIEEYHDRFYSVFPDLMTLESLIALSGNWQSAGLTRAQEQTHTSISLNQVWGYGLAEILKDPSNVVKNDLDLSDQSVFLTGSQGSGKTEALFALAETLTALSLWRRGAASQITYGGSWEVLPLISVPEQKEKDGKEDRPLSSLEKEACFRAGTITSFCENLPAGVKPIVIVDEFLSSTNTADASEGIRALKSYVESKGGILILSTHVHEAVWDMEKDRELFLGKYVGLFDTPDAYRWLDGHGESLGIEVAAKMGYNPDLIEIAQIVREYLLSVESQEIPPEDIIAQTAVKIRSIIERPK